MSYCFLSDVSVRIFVVELLCLDGMTGAGGRYPHKTETSLLYLHRLGSTEPFIPPPPPFCYKCLHRIAQSAKVPQTGAPVVYPPVLLSNVRHRVKVFSPLRPSVFQRPFAMNEWMNDVIGIYKYIYIFIYFPFNNPNTINCTQIESGHFEGSLKYCQQWINGQKLRLFICLALSSLR